MKQMLHGPFEGLPMIIFRWDVGVQAELILGAVERQEARLGRPSAGPDTYLEQRLSGDAERLMDEQGRAVMMAWEGPLMQAHAHAICQQVRPTLKRLDPCTRVCCLCAVDWDHSNSRMLLLILAASLPQHPFSK